MTFRKPFRSTPVEPGPIYLAQFRKQHRRRKIRTWALAIGLFSSVFAGGMALTNWSVVTASAQSGTAGATSFAICETVRRNCVVDGDTFWIDGEKVRIANIDAPETPGSERCRHLRYGKNPSWCDFDRGIEARGLLSEFLSSGPVKLSRQGKDRYGRTLATVTVGGEDAGAYLVEKGVARWWQK